MTVTNLVYTMREFDSIQIYVTEVYELTLVYWKVSYVPVKVASMDCGNVSMLQIPGAAQNFEHECDSLVA